MLDYENCENIAEIVIEQLRRLFIQLLTVNNMVEIWIRITAIMTDSVFKNLNITQIIAERLGVEYEQLHLHSDLL